MTIVLSLWAGWILFCLGAMYFNPPPQGVPCFNGFRIHIPETFRCTLSPAELRALVAHEEGHRYHKHVWKNFALICLFMRAGEATRWRQELEADDFAYDRGLGIELASALLKISDAHDDLKRVELLIAKNRAVPDVREKHHIKEY